MDIQIKKPRFRILLLSITLLILFGLVAMFILYRIAPRESVYAVTKEYCGQHFNEDDYLGVSNDRLNGQSYNKFQLCYEDYFWPTNKNWITLEKILLNEHRVYPPSGVSLNAGNKEQEMRAIAKQLEQQGLSLWTIVDVKNRGLYSDPPFSHPWPKYDYRRWEGEPFINEYVVGTFLEPLKYDISISRQELDHGGVPNVGEIPDGIYAAEAEEVAEKVKEVGEYNNGPVKTWSTDRSATILLAVQAINGQPVVILATYKTIKPQTNTKPYGPYLVKLASDKWLRFNSDLTLCETINVEQTNGSYVFVTGACPF